MTSWRDALICRRLCSATPFVTTTSWRADAAVLVVVPALLLVPALGLEDTGIEIVGTMPSGFAFVSCSGVTFRDVLDLLHGAFGIVVVGFAEGLAVAQAYVAVLPPFGRCARRKPRCIVRDARRGGP